MNDYEEYRVRIEDDVQVWVQPFLFDLTRYVDRVENYPQVNELAIETIIKREYEAKQASLPLVS